MQAIVTKYLGPTNYRGARVKATCDAGSVTLSWDHALNPEGNHRVAANHLAFVNGWIGPSCPGWKLLGGSMPQATPYAYCFVLTSTEAE